MIKLKLFIAIIGCLTLLQQPTFAGVTLTQENIKQVVDSMSKNQSANTKDGPFTAIPDPKFNPAMPYDINDVDMAKEINEDQQKALDAQKKAFDEQKKAEQRIQAEKQRMP